MADMNVFAFDSQAVRVVMESGEPWFVGKDVAVVLGYVNPSDALTKHCKGSRNATPFRRQAACRMCASSASPTCCA